MLGLILCCSFARNPVLMPWFMRPIIARFPLQRLPIRLLTYFLLGRFNSRRLCRALADSLAQISPATLRARAQAVLSADYSAFLSGIRLPVLYLRAGEDRVVPASAAEFVTSLAPQTHIVEFQAPHFLLQSQPLPVSSMLTRYMDEIMSPAHS